MAEWPPFGKELLIWLTIIMFSLYYVYLNFFVISCFGFEGRIWVLTVTSPGHCLLFTLNYRNDPKFTDKQVWANSADPDQTAPRGSSLFAIPFASI